MVQAHLALMDPLDESSGENPYIWEKTQTQDHIDFHKPERLRHRKQGLQDQIGLPLHFGEEGFAAFIIIDSTMISTTMTSSPTMMCD
jgi:hypothetical protein